MTVFRLPLKPSLQEGNMMWIDDADDRAVLVLTASPEHLITDDVKAWRAALNDRKREVILAINSHDELVKLLCRYGRHETTCSWGRGESSCSCGFNAALMGLDWGETS